MPQLTDKKERLIQAAIGLIHKQGFNKTTLADVAQVSGVPLGNVYYYFKTKEALGSAVVDSHHQTFIEKILVWEKKSENALERISFFIDMMEEKQKVLVEFGCPIGSLAQELDKQKTVLTNKIDNVLKLQLQWLEKQFQKIEPTKAYILAEQFLTETQGAILVAHALHDKSIIQRKAEHLRCWLRQFEEALVN